MQWTKRDERKYSNTEQNEVSRLQFIKLCYADGISQQGETTNIRYCLRSCDSSESCLLWQTHIRLLVISRCSRAVSCCGWICMHIQVHRAQSWFSSHGGCGYGRVYFHNLCIMHCEEKNASYFNLFSLHILDNNYKQCSTQTDQ